MKISQEAFEFIAEAARSAYPREFIGLLRAEKGVITEILIIPGSQFEHSYSSILTNMVPLDPSIVGSVHSHPGVALPSRQDLDFFSKSGRIHIIAGPREVRAFDRDGNPAELEIIK